MRFNPIAIFALAFSLAAAPGPAFAQAEPETQIVQSWLGSSHADTTSPSFTHWNDEGEIPGTCALCHSGQGFRDFYGLDGSTVGTIDHPVETGGVIDCDTCHAEGIREISTVTFRSGAEIPISGNTATCSTCHQGRASGVSVANAVGERDEDTIYPELSFINPHYAVAAATQLGAEAQGAYQYPGKDYAGRFGHVPPASECIDCHEPHSLMVETETCIGCHETADPETIRTSETDFDGNGDPAEGIAVEIAALHTRLMEAMVAYSREISGQGIVYNGNRFPYFFADTDADGEPDTADDGDVVRFAGWTPRLLKAAYNYKFIAGDPGAYAHNPHYALQVLHDSIESLSGPLGWDVSGLTRP
ncbi:cytochrome C [Pelagibacterium xiamenense]|uniref:cytochrome C n=1 Tax=Pelagibacterium xiamenense TaxID=2901140 RepID=UPI001E566E8C|nr:cytochrome C [Pelagibacterium xiamenense]MCD7059360.1 cytochrome C [Pelagibacterium xiamenense]